VHAEPTVKAGDHVKKGQLLADSWYTKGGQLALGTNMRVAFIPMPVMTHEDSVVVSESAAKKLSSLHLHRHQLFPRRNADGEADVLRVLPDEVQQHQLSKLDADGVIREGETVSPGDPLTVALREQKFTTEAKAIAKLSKSLIKPYSDHSTEWDQDFRKGGPGPQTPDGSAHVFIATEEPAQIADKISNYYAGRAPSDQYFRRPDAEGQRR